MKTIIVFMLTAFAAIAQTLNVPTTSGKGKVSAFIGPNAILTKDAPKVAFSYGCVAYGATSRLDVYGCATHTTLLGQTQMAVTPGVMLNLVKSRYGNFGLFQLANIPVNKTQKGSKTLFSAALVSWDLKAKDHLFSPYTGLSALVPLGQAEGKLFTPPVPILNIPIGVAIPFGRITVLGEYGLPIRFMGGSSRTFGAGIAYSIH